jgi:hypothetical protein
MPKHKSLLVPHRWTVAGRSRKCYHSPNHSVGKGDLVLEVKVQIGWQGYCEPCALEMIRLASAELQQTGAHRVPSTGTD